MSEHQRGVLPNGRRVCANCGVSEALWDSTPCGKQKPKITPAEFGLMMAFELGYKARENGKNFRQALTDFIKENLD